MTTTPAFASERARVGLARPDLLRENAFVGGAWIKSERQIAVSNPATGQAFAHDEAALAIANASRAGLAAYVYTRDLNRARRMTEGLEYGLVGLNTRLVSTELAPFAGCKESGLGREGSRYGLTEFLEMRAIVQAL
ncbi:NAD(P)+ dependent succinate-semialdehyde dehydrogenase [alpha proteobacterium U9-1i]|nr:NAD(P)+ dependent succinate-semialdehyde dehydrogenase [alpha proteobacterium U9-1i]